MLKDFIIIMDLDGTLLNNNKKISLEDLYTLQSISKNNKILIASGRNHNDIINLIYTNKIEKYILPFLVCNNGQEIYDFRKKKVIFSSFINYDVANNIINKLNKNGIYWYCTCDKNVYCRSIKYNCEKYFINKKYKLYNIDDIKTLSNIQIQKFVISIDNERLLERIKKKIYNEFYIDFMKFNREKIFNGNAYFENIIMPRQINKYESTKKILEILDLSNNIITIGDGFNDYELLLNSDYSICMDNADNRIKEICNFVTKSNCESGISYAFEKFMQNIHKINVER